MLIFLFLHSSLEKLTLSNNLINALSSQTFEGLQNLKELHISTNQISSLPDDVLYPLTSLTTLV